ncbi:MAG TPA: AtpZ/AtpI family protein [Spirochaetota bacterium]|nr:AtpZ/AtpI family protein [Spirochaetota bacterium]HPJ38687.1 AtpZ/AtpI family protein [Spirochaetota bacterium]HPQ53639.1 AtpZ/AtpI family protein [Spirochaetota bacterium]
MGKRSVNAFIAYSTAGLQLALILVLFVYGGYKLDVKFGSSPVFVLLGAILGMVFGLYNLLKGLKEVDRAMQEEKNGDKDKKRNKWL